MLAALIAAVRDAEDGSGLIATLPVAGRTLFERQVRLAIAAGAVHIVVLVERLPAAFTAAVDRLRRDGIAVEIARSAADGADRFHPDERVLVFADGALGAPATVSRLSHLPAPAILTLGEGEPAGAFERIDAGARWSGIALVSGDMLRRTVAMLGDWDLHSTLLRRAVGASARRLDIADGADIGAAMPVELVRSRAGARAATQVSATRDGAGAGWPARFLYAPIARVALAALLDRPVEARWLRWGAGAAAVLAVPAAWRGWLLAAILLLVTGAVLDATGRMLAVIRLAGVATLDRPGIARGMAMAAALLAFSAHRVDVGPTPLVLAAVTIAAVLATVRERILLARFTATPAPRWIADPDALVLVFAAGAAAHATIAGLAALALYAAGSFAGLQHRFARAAPKGV